MNRTWCLNVRCVGEGQSQWDPSANPAATSRMVYPRIVYTDLNGLWLLAEWHEVKLQYTALSMRCVPLSMGGVAASKRGPACEGVGFDPFRSSCPKAAQGTNPSNYR
jgi:hypothetical protein